MLENFNSKKLILTVLSIALVTIADQFGAPLDAETLGFIQNILMTFLGAQGSVDIAKVLKAGKTLSSGVDAVAEIEWTVAPEADKASSDER